MQNDDGVQGYRILSCLSYFSALLVYTSLSVTNSVLLNLHVFLVIVYIQIRIIICYSKGIVAVFEQDR